MDETKLVFAGNNRNVKIWDIKAGCKIRTLRGHQTRSARVAISADGKKIASTDISGVVKIWNFETGNLIRDLSEEIDTPHNVFFLSDNRTIAVCAKGEIKFWDIDTNKSVRSLCNQNVNPIYADRFVLSHTIVLHYHVRNQIFLPVQDVQVVFGTPKVDR